MSNLKSVIAFFLYGSMTLAHAGPCWSQKTDLLNHDSERARATPGIKKPNSAGDVTSRVEALQNQLEQAQARMREQQSQIDHLQESLQEVLKVLAQNGVPHTPDAQVAAEKLIPAPSSEGSVDVAVTRNAPIPGAREENRQVTSSEEPTSIRYKGLSITPGGFLEGTLLYRTRNENADISNSYTGAPLNGSSNSKLSEFRGSARDSRLSLLFQGKAGETQLTGYYETDFLGAAPTANFIQASAFTPRLRQAWVQLDTSSGWTVTGGQFWSLITTNRKGIAARAEYIPNTADGSYVAGYNWVRERAVRATRNFHDHTWVAVEVDDPENTFSAAFVPANVMGLNTSQNASTGVLLLPFLANYSNGHSTTVAPDLLAKVAFEPGWGHFEIKALGRFFRDRIASTTTTVGHTNTAYGYGLGFGAILPVASSKVDVIGEGLFGQGIGRYGASGLPDVTLDPTTGKMLPLREAQIMGGVEWHPRTNLNFYAYGGNEYAGRYAAVTSTGAAAGYGSPLVSYASCTNEVAMNTCSGANHDISEATVGYWYGLYKGTFGSMQYGNQVVYLHRTLWSGTGPTPKGSDLVIYSTMRFYLP